MVRHAEALSHSQDRSFAWDAGPSAEAAAQRGQAHGCVQLTFPAPSKEGVWCSSSLLHMSHALAPAALAQMSRVLVKAGTRFLSLLEGESERWESEASEFVQ